MSSESSATTSSRLRQFGLYRTIDARTEEFLKLSRRRQIRQGCACAAVSTAITVTVVVSVLLVYEYGFHVDTELSQSRHRPHWLSMLNDSDASFDKNIQKTNFNINRNTLKFLPILLKAIKQNRYLEKVIDDYSSQAPAYEKHTTDYPLERNVFTDARNWVRMPASRLYAIEYKSTPIVFFKTRNIDNFAKSTKITNSQRIMSYFDRMINDKVGYGPAVRMISYNPLKSTSSTPAPIIALADSFFKNQNQKTTNFRSNEISISKELDKAYCKCPNNLGLILKKLLTGIQQLIPDNKEPNLSDFICRGGIKLKTATSQAKTMSNASRSTSTEAIPKTTTKCETMKGDVPINCRTQSKIRIDEESNLRFRPKPKNTNNIQNIILSMKKLNKIPQKDFTNIILSRNYPNLDLKETYDSHSFEDTTTMTAHIEPTDDNDFKYITTTPMAILPRGKMHSQVETVKRFILKHQENNQDFGDVFHTKTTTKNDKVSDYVKENIEMKNSAASFMHQIEAHEALNNIMNLKNIATNKPAISKLKKHLQIEPLKSFTSKHQGKKTEFSHPSLSPKSTTNSYKLYKFKANNTKIRKKSASHGYFSNITEYIEPTKKVDFKNITNNKRKSPTIDVSKVKSNPKVETVESFLLEHQGNEQDFGEKPLFPSSATVNYNLYDFEEEKAKIRKTTALNQFLHQLEEYQKYNKNFGINFNKKQEPNQENNVHATTDTIITLHAIEKDGNNKQDQMKTEVLNSMIPQNRPPFLEIRRNDGRREDRDYDEDTNMNNFIYD